MRWFRSFISDMSGNFAVTAAIGLVPIMGAVALGVDYASVHSKRGELQELADAAALAVAKEKSLSALSDTKIQQLLDNYVQANYRPLSGESLTVSARKTADANAVGVDLSLMWQPFFAHMMDTSVLPLNASATASFSGDTASICILALNETDGQTLDMTNQASMAALGCGVFSNAKASNSINLHSQAKLSGSEIFSSGGYSGKQASFNKLPITDAPPIEDPLAARPAPVVRSCDYTNFSATEYTVTLKPGVYCNGLHLAGDVIANLQPGTYIIKDGPLTVGGNATIKGKHVGFYLTGSSAVFDFGVSTQADLIAPKSGPLSGILFFEDRSSAEGRTFTIRSKDAERFEGVVYLPKGTLWVDKASRVDQQSNWTAIITNKIVIGTGPDIVVKSDYGASDVPVPEGIESTSDIRLVK